MIDDEPPLFQNRSSPYDVNNDGRTTSSDALRVINHLPYVALSRNSIPSVSNREGCFGTSMATTSVSALDALMIINEISRVRPAHLIGEGGLAEVNSLGIADKQDDEVATNGI